MNAEIVSLESRLPAGFRAKPHNIELEQSVLGGLMLVAEIPPGAAVGMDLQDALFACRRLRAEHFYEPVHGRIFAAIQRHADAGRPPTWQVLLDEFGSDTDLQDVDGGAYLQRLAKASAGTWEIGSYVGHLIDLAAKRSLIALCEDMANQAYDTSNGAPGAAEMAVSVKASLDTICDDTAAPTWRSTADVAMAVVARLDNPAAVFSTGLKSLDDAMHGGLREGKVYGIEAAPKSFKTGTMATMAKGLMASNVPFLWLALEMGAEEIFERLISAEFGGNSMQFLNQAQHGEAVQRSIRYAKKHANNRAMWLDAPGIAFSGLRSTTVDAVRLKGIKVLFLDYWQLVAGADPRANGEAHLAMVAQWLHDFSRKHRVAVVLASQTNVEGRSYGSQRGLARATDWLMQLHKIDDHDPWGREQLWGQVVYDRMGPIANIGNEDAPAWTIDTTGPVLVDASGPPQDRSGRHDR